MLARLGQALSRTRAIRSRRSLRTLSIVAEAETGMLCFFCQEGIEKKGLDPCMLTLIVRFLSDEESSSQWLFCHFDCLAKHDNPEFPLLFRDSE
ncbi:MAG: hypothetical protein QOE13_916 [Gaiellaceae bacterium]|jgi:hypothetical protein|nr:hypothetical protein [Gaiellaceae bacterium]